MPCVKCPARLFPDNRPVFLIYTILLFLLLPIESVERVSVRLHNVLVIH